MAASLPPEFSGRLSPIFVGSLESYDLNIDKPCLAQGKVTVRAKSLNIKHIMASADGNVTVTALEGNVTTVACPILAPHGNIYFSAAKGSVHLKYAFEGIRFEIYKKHTSVFSKLSETVRQYILANEELLSFGIDYSQPE